MKELLLGFALGSGVATSFRLFGFLGVSEILFALFIFLAIREIGFRYLFRFSFDFKGLVKLTLFICIYIISPLMTLMNILYFHLEKAQPKYILDFMIGYILTFLLIELMKKKKIKMYRVAIFFAFAFLSIVVLSYYIFSDISYYGSVRFKSFAKNPNQMLFYGITLSLFIVMYIRQKTLKITCFVLIVYFMLKTLSDAYYLSLFVAISMFLFLHIFYIKKLKKSLNILLYMFLITIVAIPIIYLYYNQIGVLWNTADEGGVRLYLYKNAFLSISHSPVIGLGIGSFSGVFAPFCGEEAHNTFLDLAMQFGIFFLLSSIWYT